MSTSGLGSRSWAWASLRLPTLLCCAHPRLLQAFYRFVCALVNDFVQLGHSLIISW